MAETLKISIPPISDDPLIGRYSAPFTFSGDDEYIIIEDETLKYMSSATSRPLKSFRLNEISKLLLVKKEDSCWTKDHKFDPWATIGTKAEISIVDIKNKKHVLIPSFLLESQKKEWDRFLQKLSLLTDIPLEGIT